MERLCVFVYMPGTDCLDTGCRLQGGACELTEGGKPDCRCKALLPSPNRFEGAIVASPIELYRQAIGALSPPSSSEFAGSLARYRAGDDLAARELCAGCLGVALSLVESESSLPVGFSLLDAVQEANLAVKDSLPTFLGASLSDLHAHVARAVQNRLRALEQQGAA